MIVKYTYRFARCVIFARVDLATNFIVVCLACTSARTTQYQIPIHNSNSFEILSEIISCVSCQYVCVCVLALQKWWKYQIQRCICVYVLFLFCIWNFSLYIQNWYEFCVYLSFRSKTHSQKKRVMMPNTFAGRQTREGSIIYWW